jgi:tyrocidine synthetase-3
MSTYYKVQRDFDHNIPIGKPNSNSTVYIFDKNMNCQPVGVPGELYVGGDGLSTGYLNRDELNKRSFMEHPNIPGERIYRTGDLARWLPDWNIEFLGRADNQLKIRGYRVELEEIESVISEVDGVIETVIKPLKLVEGDFRLVAFLNVPETFNVETNEIMSEIRTKLPSYMVPSAFKFMHGFPKTINGKIDRKALTIDISELGKQRTIDVNTFSPTERIIHTVWCDVLKIYDISLTDSFFDVGGNSLLAITVMSEIESVFNINIGLRVFFDSPRIKDLAEIVDIASLKISEKKPNENKAKTESKIINGEI